MAEAREYAFPVEHGHLALYDRAIGDLDAGYPDTAGVVAEPAVAPTFLAAEALFDPESGSRPRPPGWQPPAGGTGGAMAAEAHFEYHRPVRVGEVLRVCKRPGDTWQKTGRKGGTLTFRETVTEFRDDAGDLVATMRRVAVRAERTPAG